VSPAAAAALQYVSFDDDNQYDSISIEEWRGDKTMERLLRRHKGSDASSGSHQDTPPTYAPLLLNRSRETSRKQSLNSLDQVEVRTDHFSISPRGKHSKKGRSESLGERRREVEGKDAMRAESDHKSRRQTPARKISVSRIKASRLKNIDSKSPMNKSPIGRWNQSGYHTSSHYESVQKIAKDMDIRFLMSALRLPKRFRHINPVMTPICCPQSSLFWNQVAIREKWHWAMFLLGLAIIHIWVDFVMSVVLVEHLDVIFLAVVCVFPLASYISPFIGLACLVVQSPELGRYFVLFNALSISNAVVAVFVAVNLEVPDYFAITMCITLIGIKLLLSYAMNQYVAHLEWTKDWKMSFQRVQGFTSMIRSTSDVNFMADLGGQYQSFHGFRSLSR